MDPSDILNDARDPRSGGYKVDVNRGERIGAVLGMVLAPGGRTVSIPVGALRRRARPR